jgi:Ca2+-binding RTX toxin-like protein
VASFTDTNLAAGSGDFTASINWGDGSAPTTGVVSGGNGSFTVSGAHTYLAGGTDALTVTLADDAPGTASATAQGSAEVEMVATAPALLDVIKDAVSGLTKLIGHAEGSSQVSVFDAGKLLGTTTAGSDGVWTLLTNATGNVVHSFTNSWAGLAANTPQSAGVTLYTASAHKDLAGGSGNDVLIAGNNDTLTGGGGSDTFVFNSGVNKATISDFNVAQDSLVFDHSLFSVATAAQVLSQTHDSAAGAVISSGSTTLVTLTGVHLADLQAHPGDIHFI